ncbi:type III pantothenate kinase [Nitrosomonas sp.]|uniref:type III pantothenate kinase n=1 Tax=Nitrosomonas sp. TaxID=42353 RepID=UPI001D47FD66|nr:type III pantothenate kinase [Nitrosomonas sp.]MBX3616422.1 type III pantothenate kinase [Nitrosomonas sp.]
MSRILVIDSGNSYFKWGFYQEDSWLAKGEIANAEIISLSNVFERLPCPLFIIISHVTDNISKSDIEEIISLWPINPYWLRAGTFQCEVFNGYHLPDQLGSDRWAALIAAWNTHHKACLVVNVGTAVTIDALSDAGEFLGGVILPSAHSMRDCLQSRTQLKNLRIGFFQTFPQTTDDAVHSGLMHCVLGAIERIYQIISEKLKSPNLKCFVSGGGCAELIPFFKIPVESIDNLVMEGLVIIANDIMFSRKKYE